MGLARLQPVRHRPDADPASSGRKAAATRSFIERAPSATFCPVACAPVLATLPTPAAAPEAAAGGCRTRLKRRPRAAGGPSGGTRSATGQLGGCGRHARPAATAPPTPVAAAPTATAAPAAPSAAPAIAPAPSCGPPDTSPVAMPGPKMPKASSVSEVSITTTEWSMDGSAGCT